MAAPFGTIIPGEEITTIAPVTRKYANLGHDTGMKPVSPDKHIKGERLRISLAELLTYTTKELAQMGISEDEVIQLLLDNSPDSPAEIIFAERNPSDFDEVLGWAENYWAGLGSRLRSRIESAKPGRDIKGLISADAKIRSLGVDAFLEAAADYTSREVLLDTAHVMYMASDMFIMSELLVHDVSPDKKLFAQSMNELVSTGVTRPDLFDRAVSMAVANLPDNSAIKTNIQDCVVGVKAELLAVSIMASLADIDRTTIANEMRIQKPSAERDAKDKHDLVVVLNGQGDSEGEKPGVETEICVVEVKTSGERGDTGACQIIVENGEVTVLQAGHKAPHLIDQYEIDPKFIASIRNNESLAGMVIRINTLLAKRYTAVEIADGIYDSGGVDNSADNPYTALRAQISGELGQIYRRFTDRERSNG